MVVEDRVQAHWRWTREVEETADGRGELIRDMARHGGVRFDRMVEIVGEMRRRGVRLPKPL